MSGCGVDRKTVYYAATRNQSPLQRLGNRVLFSRAALVSWLACESGSAQECATPARCAGDGFDSCDRDNDRFVDNADCDPDDPGVTDQCRPTVIRQPSL
jgi:hypothetical protein